MRTAPSAREPADDSLDFRQRIAVMPRLLDDADLAEFRTLGIDVASVRRSRRKYLRELLADVERESARLATRMASLPNPEITAIVEFRLATRHHIRKLRWLAFLHALGLDVQATSRKHSAAVSAMLLSAAR